MCSGEQEQSKPLKAGMNHPSLIKGDTLRQLPLRHRSDLPDVLMQAKESLVGEEERRRGGGYEAGELEAERLNRSPTGDSETKRFDGEFIVPGIGG